MAILEKPVQLSTVQRTIHNGDPNLQGKLSEDDTSLYGYPIGYLMDVKLESKQGSDIPLYDTKIKFNLDKDRERDEELRKKEARFGKKQMEEMFPDYERPGFPHRELWTLAPDHGEELDYETEDYWIFSVNLPDNGTVDVWIGGETPVKATSGFNLKNITDRREAGSFKLPNNQRFDDNCSINAEDERYFAVRCPKMSNPAITVMGWESRAQLNWVGLFLKNAADNKNQFIAVKTTNRLLPLYAKQTEQEDWFDRDSGVDLNSRPLLMFPKQLFGTEGSNRAVYNTFVQTDPGNWLGKHHKWYNENQQAELAKAGVEVKSESYSWNANGVTTIKRSVQALTGSDRFSSQRYDYARSSSIENESGGWDILLEVLGNVANIANSVLTGNLVGAIDGVFKIASSVDENLAKDTANSKGFVTSMVELVQTVVKRKKEKKDEKNDEYSTVKLTTNTRTAKELMTASKIFIGDFGKE